MRQSVLTKPLTWKQGVVFTLLFGGIAGGIIWCDQQPEPPTRANFEACARNLSFYKAYCHSFPHACVHNTAEKRAQCVDNWDK